MNYIYLVTNKENGKQYIGQTTYDVKTRWRNHVYHSKHSLDNNYFHRAIRKYGEKSFEISIVEEIEDYNLLDEKEIFYISFYPLHDTFELFTLVLNPLAYHYVKRVATVNLYLLKIIEQSAYCEIGRPCE